MGTRGPAPKRSDQKAGHHKPPEVTKVVVRGRVEPPEPRSTWSDSTLDWYAGLAQSGQSVTYEPSDWQEALFIGDLMEDYKREPMASLAVAILKGYADLGVSDSARKRSGVEVNREQSEDDAEDAREAIADLRAIAGGA